MVCAGLLLLALILLSPDLWRFIPIQYRPWWVEILASIAVVAYVVARVLGAGRFGSAGAASRARRYLDWLDWFAGRALDRWLAVGLGVWCVFVLAGWVPHYLTWPMGRDDDTFATLAQSWDSGILPYRDIRAYNFPGQTYLFWVLGKIFGWGCSIAIRGFDALCVVGAGLAMAGWSRARLGGIVPGLIGYMSLMGKYFDMQTELTGQRDWYTALLVCGAIVILEARPGRWARLLSASLVALAVSVRPQAVLFLPALVSAISEDPQLTELGFVGRLRVTAIWCLWAGLFVTLAFAPVLLAGVGGDFIRSLGVVAYGGPYSKANPELALASFLGEFNSWTTVVALGVTVVFALQPRNALGALARTWLLALLAALIYRPIAPIQHFYLILPLLVVSSSALALGVSWLKRLDRLPRPIVVLALAMMAYESMPGLPLMFSLRESGRALRSLAMGETRATAPIGCGRFFAVTSGKPSPDWDAYRALLSEIRTTTSPHTLVANGFNRFPYLPINGPTGRLSPFRAESGICWMCFVDINLDSEFAQSLEAATDSVVVWEPEQRDPDGRIKVERLFAVVRRLYEPSARFGTFEIWTRKR
jgi:hypothetical protein